MPAKPQVCSAGREKDIFLLTHCGILKGELSVVLTGVGVEHDR